jgi:hypothetical protein
LDPSKLDCAFESLDKNNKLSEAMKSFSSTAKALRIDFIKEKLGSKKPSGITRIIPVTVEEQENQLSENSMTNKELISVINSLVGSLDEANQPQFKGLGTKKKKDLLLILQQAKYLNNGANGSEIEETI